MSSLEIIKYLCCPKCSASLKSDAEHLVCAGCGSCYQASGPVSFLNLDAPALIPEKSDSFLSNLKKIFKQYPKVYGLFYYLLGALFVGQNAKKSLAGLSKGALIVNLGSGPKRIRPDVINVDLLPLPNVDIIADIAHLPFGNATVDAVISELVLEHVSDPQAVLTEMERVLKPGGLIYLVAPFVENFHSSPGDYFRWTKPGLKIFFQNFEEKKTGIRCGPASAFAAVSQEFFALLLSFGWRPLQQFWSLVFMIILSPVKLLDIILSKFPGAENISLAFYYIGIKK